MSYDGSLWFMLEGIDSDDPLRRAAERWALEVLDRFWTEADGAPEHQMKPGKGGMAKVVSRIVARAVPPVEHLAELGVNAEEFGPAELELYGVEPSGSQSVEDVVAVVVAKMAGAHVETMSDEDVMSRIGEDPGAGPETSDVEESSGMPLDRLLDEAASENYVYVKLGAPLEQCVKLTRAYVRSLDGLEQAASDMVAAASGRGGRPAWRIAEQSAVFDKEMKKVYPAFAAAREQFYVFAKVAGITTKRFSKKSTSQSLRDQSEEDLVNRVRDMARSFQPSVRASAETASFFLARADQMVAKMGRAKNPPTMEQVTPDLQALVTLFLDFRDQTSAALFKIAGGIYRRANELRVRNLRRLECMESEELTEAGAKELKAPWASDKELKDIAEGALG